MDKPNRFVNIIIWLIFFLLAIQLFFWPITGVFLLTMNANIALVLGFVSLLLKFHKSKKGQYVIFISLVLLTFNIITFIPEIIQGDVSGTDILVKFGLLGIDPISFLLLIAYCIINIRTIAALLRTLFYVSEKEQEENENKNITFYYDKFNTCSSDELNNVLKMYKEYPEEAQIAIKRVQEERNVI